MSAYYFDDDEEGLARETSHPFFVEHATADFYYNCGDEFSPFGNDSGADTLFNLQDWYNERGANEKALTFLKRQIGAWEFSSAYLTATEAAQLDTIIVESDGFNNEIDKAVIATVFGQFKIAGKCDKAMLPIAAAFQRQRYIAEKARTRELRPWEHAAEYLARLEVMETDLQIMANKKAC
ncbi:MAG: MolR family transcriptional regulator [Janthinobacterium lividum]